MKISRISLQSFRAFDEAFELDLDGGKNLLLYGENGSGKSSIYLALKRFFEEQGDDISKHSNIFSPAARFAQVGVHIKGVDASGHGHDELALWNATSKHPLSIPEDPRTAIISPELRAIMVDASRRAGFLDYRAMLRTSLLSAPLPRSNHGPNIHNIIYGAESIGLEAQLFDLVSLVILAGVRVTVTGGRETTLGQLARKVWENRPASRHKRVMANANQNANSFNSAFNAKLPELEAKLAEFLNHFENHQLAIKFLPVALAWDKPSLQLKGAELTPQITFRGKNISDHQHFLNEARLSALATCLFFSGVILSDNDSANPAYPRFLVLDDALIGLDLQNRLSILQILSSDTFKNYQIFLLTYDRVWFDLARGHLREGDGWLHKELIADETTGKLIPRHRSFKSDLARAQLHLDNDDLKAAGVYARSAFEWKLRKVCESHAIQIPFKGDADTVGAGALWDGIIARQKERVEQQRMGSRVPDFVGSQLVADVETMRSTVLNKLSHTGSSTLVKTEVQTAINTVSAIHAHTFPKI